MIKILLLTLSLILSSCAREKITLDLPALVAQAERYQLPKPPPEAKLILAKTAWTSVGNSSVDLDPAIYQSGFLLGENPDKSEEYYAKYSENRRTDFFDDLRLTVKSPAPKPGSIEDLIYQSAYLDVPPHMRKPDHPIFKIHLQGTAAIPELVRLSTSRKLTPAIQPAIMKSREKRLRLGHLATAILEDMTAVLAPGKPRGGSFRFYTFDERWKPWLAKTNLTDEKSFFLKALGKVEKKQEYDLEVPLFILLNKFPESLQDLAQRFSKSQKRDLFMRILSDSKINKPAKIKALKKVAQNQKSLDRSYLFQVLAKLDPETVKSELLPLIESLPKDVSEPYWTAEEANLTYVVVQLEDPVIWKAWLAKTKTCAIGLRMEMLQPMGQVRTNKKIQNLRLAFLAVFLNDTEIRKVKRNDKRWKGPHAGFTYDTLSVQNFVAEKIAHILKIPGQPADHWTEKQWKPYRKKVEATLSKLTLPSLSR